MESELENQLGRRSEIEQNLVQLNSNTSEPAVVRAKFAALAQILDLMRVDSEQLQSSLQTSALLADKVGDPNRPVWVKRLL
eukprot:scaffold121744_cov36-Prasinocladus_malaysianus.AAC.1